MSNRNSHMIACCEIGSAINTGQVIVQIASMPRPIHVLHIVRSLYLETDHATPVVVSPVPSKVQDKERYIYIILYIIILYTVYQAGL